LIGINVLIGIGVRVLGPDNVSVFSSGGVSEESVHLNSVGKSVVGWDIDVKIGVNIYRCG